jgi:hypothetical protein
MYRLQCVKMLRYVGAYLDAEKVALWHSRSRVRIIRWMNLSSCFSPYRHLLMASMYTDRIRVDWGGYVLAVTMSLHCWKHETWLHYHRVAARHRSSYTHKVRLLDLLRVGSCFNTTLAKPSFVYVISYLLCSIFVAVLRLSGRCLRR